MVATRFPIDESHVLQFARAVGDPNPAYTYRPPAAPGRPDTILAPPTFMMAADHFDPGYARRPRPGVPWFGSGREVSGSGGEELRQTGFHAEQVFVYHRHPVVGDVLRATEREGNRWERAGRRGGMLRFRETITEFVDQAGNPTVTAIFLGVTTERLVDAASTASTNTSPVGAIATPASSLPRLGPFALGATSRRLLVKDLTRTEIVMYAGASGDFHPLHHDATFAVAMGYPGIFAHGMLTMGLTSRLVTDVVGDATLSRWSARFSATVWPGDTLTATATVEVLRGGGDPQVDLAVRVANQHGAEVLRGLATARVEVSAPGGAT